MIPAFYTHPHIDGFVQERRNSSALAMELRLSCINILRPWQNVRRFADDTFKRIFLNENVRISIKISLRFVPKGPINNIPALVQIMAWRRSGVKPLSELMMVSLLMHICVTRPQWVNPSICKIILQWLIKLWYLLCKRTRDNIVKSCTKPLISSSSYDCESLKVRWSTLVDASNSNSLWPSNAVQRHRSRSTLAWIMACCLTAPNHYLKQCWFLTSEVLWHSPEVDFTGNAKANILYNEFENYIFQITATSPRGQWVKKPNNEQHEIKKIRAHKLQTVNTHASDLGGKLASNSLSSEIIHAVLTHKPKGYSWKTFAEVILKIIFADWFWFKSNRCLRYLALKV